MAAEPATSSPSAALPNNDKPVIVRVKHKSYQSPLEAFWLEGNERPVKRPLLDFHKLSINDSASKVEELKSKKFFVRHVETLSSSEVAVDIVQSFAASKPDSTDALETKTKHEDQRRSNKTDNSLRMGRRSYKPSPPPRGDYGRKRRTSPRGGRYGGGGYGGGSRGRDLPTNLLVRNLRHDCRREFTHRVKSVSMAKFTSQEVSALQGGGNASAKEIYFKEWDAQRQSFPDSSNVERLQDFIKHVYVDRRYSGERSFDKPPRSKTGEIEGSRSPLYENERRYSDRPSPGGSSRNSYDERRSPGYDQDFKKSPARTDVVNDWRREDRLGNGKRSDDGGSKVEGRSPDRQSNPDMSGPPTVRPVRDILGDSVSPQNPLKLMVQGQQLVPFKRRCGSSFI